MPSPTTFQTTHHSTSNNVNSTALSSSHNNRPFTIGRRTIITTNTANNNKNSRPIYGRRSKSYDTRLNAHVTNEKRVPLDVKIRHDDAKYNQSSPLTSLKKKKDRRDDNKRWSGSQEKDGARMRSAMSTTITGKQHDDLEVCQESSLSPDIGAVAENDVNNDKDVKAQKSSKRRLSYHDNDNDVVNHHAMKNMSGHENKTSKKVKRRRMRLSDNENIRPNIHDNANNDDEADQGKEDDEEENLSFTDSIITHKDLHTSKSSKAQRRRHSSTALTVGVSNTNTITIRSKANATTGNTHIIRGSSQIKDLREFAKMNNGTAMQYKATYHTGSKPIHDKNLVGGSKNGGGGGVNNNMIQPGQLIIKETSVTSKGNKGGNSYSFDQWKLPGSKRRDSSIYESTRPKLPSSILGGKSGAAGAAALSTCAPYLIVDTALSKVDADRVRKFVRDGMVGQTPLEFFATTCDKPDGDEGNHDGDEDDDDAVPFDGSIVSDEEDEVGWRKEEVKRKVLGDRSNTTMGRKILKRKVLKQPSPHVKLSNTYHKGRTKSARKKRKSAQISPTEPRKRRMVNDNVRFFVSEPNEEGCQKRFGLIEGIGGGCEEEGLSHLTPHRGRILELPGAVKSGQWETRIMKDGTNDGDSSTSMRISLRHESSSLRPLENIVSGKDDAPDEHFVSIIKPEVTRKQSLVNHGILQDEELDGDEQITNNAFIGCVSLVLFDGFLSSSESVNLSSDVASTFLKNCVPSKELQIGCDLYGIVGNEHDSKDDENITGVLYPCKLSFDSDHIVLILCNEECQVCGIDIVFHPSKDWLRNHPLTEALLRDSHDIERSESEAGEIMRRYLEKNVAQVLKRPSPLLKHQVQSEDRSDSGTESIGFTGADQPDFDVEQDEFPLAKDECDEEKALQCPEMTQEESVEYNEKPTPVIERICRLEEEKVKRLEEEKRTLAERIQHLEEEKRLETVQRLEAEKNRLAQRVQHLEEEKLALAQQTTDKALVEPIERTVNQSLVDPSQITKSAVLRRNASAKKKKNAVAVKDLFGDTDSLFDELTNRNQQPESDPTPKSKALFCVKDLFGESESLFGVGTKKRINRRKSTSDLPNPRTLSKKQDRARHSTGALTNNPQNSLGLAVPTKRLSRRTPATASQTRHTIEPETVATTHLSSRSHRSTTRKSKGMGVKKKKVDVSELFGEESGLSVRTKTKKANKSSTFTVPKESRGKLRFSTGTNATTSTAALTTSTAKKSMGTSRKAKMVDVSDLFEQDSGSLFGCSAKSRRFAPNRIAHDSQSISSIGGASCSFESLSTQSLNKVQVVTPVQPLFDVYYGKETGSQNDYNRSDGSVSSTHHFETQPFFDCFFGQESCGNCDDESTAYSSQPLHSLYYGQYDNESAVQSITSTFEVTTASPSLLYFGQEPTEEEEDDDDELTAYPVQPFYSIYYGNTDAEGSVTSSTLTDSTMSLQSPTTRCRYFHDYYFGQESSAVDAKDDDDATETSWRSGFAFAIKFIFIGVLPTLIPMAVFISKQDNTTFSPRLDVYNVMEQSTTASFWRLKPWE